MSISKELKTVAAYDNAMANHIIVPDKTKGALQSYDVANTPQITNLSVSDIGLTRAGIARFLVKRL